MKRELTIEELRRKARRLNAESRRLIERARRIEAETRALVKSDAEHWHNQVSRKFT